jgi:hypothetical protein
MHRGAHVTLAIALAIAAGSQLAGARRTIANAERAADDAVRRLPH